MPNIKKLASQGIYFKNTYAGITKTDPSISSIFCGRYPKSIGLITHGQWITAEEENNLKKVTFLPEILKRAGYQTMAVDWLGRWHQQGYSQYSGKIIPEITANSLINDNFLYLKYFRKIDRLFLVRFFKNDFLTRLAFSPLLKNPVPYDPADIVVDQAINYLQFSRKKPFFLYLHFWDPHWPHMRPQNLKSWLFDSVTDRYYAETKFVDKHLGRLFYYLKEKNLLKDTLIVFTGDHGESLTEHNLFIAHQGLYEEVLRVPLIFSHPQLGKKTINALTAHVDILPTILNFLKIKPLAMIDGYSLLPLIFNRQKKTRDYVFFEDIVFGQMKIKKAKRRRGIRIGDYKFIQDLKINDQNISQLYLDKNIKVMFEELFNLKKDPHEKNNLSSLKRYQKQKEKLRKTLVATIQELKRKSKKWD